MNKSKLIKYSLINSLAVTVYVAIVGSLMYYGPQRFIPTPTVLVPITFLLLFVLSAAVVGLLIFARPVLLYFTGQKKESISLVLYTIGCLAIITIIALVLAVWYV